jgi:GAF domain-containing protein
MSRSGDTLLLPARLAEVRRSGLLDTGPEEPFDRLTRLACELLGTPYGFVTVVDERRSFWKSCIGVDSTALADRQNPVGESFCQYVIATDEAVVIDDARLDPMTRDNPSIESMGVIAWAGFPVRAPNGQILGTFCVVDSRPRRWSDQDRRTLQVLAQAAGGEVGLRIAADEAAQATRAAQADADKYEQLARMLQETLLPKQLPAIDGLDIAAAHRLPDGEVLGSFYDAGPTPTGWALLLGETTGRGVHAARTGALARGSLLGAAGRVSSPVIVLTELHAALQRWFDQSGTPGLVSVAYVALRRDGDGDGDGYAVRICTAGHCAAFVRRAAGSLDRLGPPTGALGGKPRLSLKVDDAELRPGDHLLLVSGGIADVADDLLPGLFADAPAADARQLADAVLDSAVSHGGSVRDDIVALSVRVP